MSSPQVIFKRRKVSSSNYELLSAEKTQDTVGRNLSELLQFTKNHFDVENANIIVETFHRTECRAALRYKISQCMTSHPTRHNNAGHTDIALTFETFDLSYETDQNININLGIIFLNRQSSL